MACQVKTINILTPVAAYDMSISLSGHVSNYFAKLFCEHGEKAWVYDMSPLCSSGGFGKKLQSSLQSFSNVSISPVANVSPLHSEHKDALKAFESLPLSCFVAIVLYSFSCSLCAEIHVVTNQTQAFATPVH